jgi:probable F420-dependent oxidoreductase
MYGVSCNALLGYTPGPRDLVRLAQEAEKIGYHSILVADHVLTPRSFDESQYPAGIFDTKVPWYDPFILLASIAGVTKTIRVGTGIAVVPYRPPIQQAQAIATLDFISEGRFFYGAGIGWMREEFDAIGVPFGERGQRTDEYLRVMQLLLSGTGEGFSGKYVNFAGAHLNPLPAQKPRPPFIIGGETPPALRRIARYGDGFHINWKTIPQFKAILAELAVYMGDNQREISSLYKQLAVTEIELIRAEKDRLHEFAELGVDEFIFSPKCYSVDEGLETIKRFSDEIF